MKEYIAITAFLSVCLMFGVGTSGQTIEYYVHDKVIALDAGQGGEAGPGTLNVVTLEDDSTMTVASADVNETVLILLKEELENRDAIVVETERFDTRHERIADAIVKCKEIGGRKCDIVVSIHHDGNTDPTHDGTWAAYSQKWDLPLAQALHDALLAAMGAADDGFFRGAYGMTVMRNLVSAITGAYYITNDCEAEAYYQYCHINPSNCAVTDADPDKYSKLLKASPQCLSNDIYTQGGILKDRVTQEVTAQLVGLENYFAAAENGGKPGKK